MTDSNAYTLDQFRPGFQSRNTCGTNAGASTVRSFQPSDSMKEVNRMLKLFIAGQTYAMAKWDALRNNEEGQTMAEYGVVLTVIAIGVIVALTALSGGIGAALDAVTEVLNPA